MLSARSLLFAVALTPTLLLAQSPVTFTVLHSNDLHAHVEPTIIQGKPYGGYARQATLIRRYRQQDPNTLLLNAGDCFQGTMFFNTYEGLVECAFMNEVGYDAMCLGNHEFDRGPLVTADFVKYAKFPVLCANLDMSGVPELGSRVKPYAILNVAGQRVGVVGAVTPDVTNISSPGPDIKLLDLAASVQAGIDELEKQGVNKIFLLTHIGYNEDQQLVKQLHGVDVVVGGHSHTPLGTPALPGWPPSAGPYPTVVNDSLAQKVYVLQSWEWGKVFGHFRVSFDARGLVTFVNDAAPIVVDETIPEDPTVASMVAAFRKPIDAQMNHRIGETKTELARSPINLMANVIADAMLGSTAKFGAVAAFVNAGGVRANLNAGPITYGQALSVQPFGNTLVTLSLSGSELQKALEEGVPAPDKTGGMLYPSRGTSYRLDFSKPAGQHVSDVVIAGRPLDPRGTYVVALPSFTAAGGDAHFVLRDAKGARVDTKLNDLDVLIAYITSHSPIEVKSESRVSRSN